MPARSTLTQTYTQAASREVLKAALHDSVAAIESVTFRTHSSCPDSMITTAGGATWTRAARRKKLKGDTMAVDAEPNATVQLVCQIDVSSTATPGAVSLEFQWIQGRDRGLFESFTSHIARKVGSVLGIS